MPNTTLSCSCCGELLVFQPEEVLRTCPACGTPNAAPRSTGDTLHTLQRAVQQRLACDFHNAETSYQQVLLLNPDEHEALWGLLLCRYGVEYVDDPATGKRLPTVHSVQPKPMQEQADFRRACDFAPEAVRAQYEREAAYIDEAQAEIRRMAEKLPAYDVFICHKTTLSGGGYTQDFQRATQLYHYLKDQGVRAFFAPECLQSAAGANYEAGIYHALHTARVMLVLCSEPEHLSSPWVRSEWTRFLEMADASADKRLIPLLYNGYSPAQLPAPFRLRKLQGLDMGDITAPQTLLKLVCDVLEKPEAPSAKTASAKAAAAAPAATPSAKPAAASHQPVPETKNGEVVFEFPRLIPEWKYAPRWRVCLDDKKNTVFAPFKWAKTSLVPLAETASVTVREDRVSPWWPLLLVLGTFLGLYAFFIGAPVFAAIYIMRIRRHFRKVLTFTITPGKRYRLHWDENEKLAVEEL